MDEEIKGYKDKVENMKLLLKHYHSQLESQKIRRDGVETVSRLLAEARQENLALKKKQAAMDTLIQNLHNRLIVNGISTSHSVEGDEVIVPGMSKQTLNSLVVENARLRNMLHSDQKNNTNSDIIESVPVLKEETQQDVETEKKLQQTIANLEAENKSMKMKLTDLEQLFKSSNNCKDRKLIAYQEEIKQLSEGSGQKSSLGKLHSDLPALREKLKALVLHCEDFGSQLKNLEESSQQEDANLKNAVIVTRINPESNAILEEKEKLERKLEEVLEMNQRWQQYCSERDKYTSNLEAKVIELETSLKDAMHGSTAQEISRRVQQHLDMSKEKIEQVEEMRHKAEEEANQLRNILVAREAEMEQMKNEISILSRPGLSHVDTSTIEILKAQIQVCTEDFEKERQDRQVALRQVDSLKDKLSKLQRDNDHLQVLLMQRSLMPQRPFPQEHSQYGRHDYNNLEQRGGRREYLAYDGSDLTRLPQKNRPMQDFPDFECEYSRGLKGGPSSLPVVTSELVARTPQPKQSVSAVSLEKTVEPKQENFLTCPKCNKEFSEENQGELLRHMDICWE